MEKQNDVYYAQLVYIWVSFKCVDRWPATDVIPQRQNQCDDSVERNIKRQYVLNPVVVLCGSLDSAS